MPKKSKPAIAPPQFGPAADWRASVLTSDVLRAEGWMSLMEAIQAYQHGLRLRRAEAEIVLHKDLRDGKVGPTLALRSTLIFERSTAARRGDPPGRYVSTLEQRTLHASFWQEFLPITVRESRGKERVTRAIAQRSGTTFQLPWMFFVQRVGAGVSARRPAADETATPARKSRGPAKGAVSRYAAHDLKFFPAMRKHIAKGMTTSAAAQMLGDKLKGHGTPESKATRLARLYRKENSTR